MWSLCLILVIWLVVEADDHLSMADKRPKRERKARSNTEFFGAGLLYKEEVELRRALNASLREVRRSHPKKEEKPSKIAITTRLVCGTTNTEVHVCQKDEKSDEPVELTKTVCIGTNTMFRIKSDRTKKSDTNKGKRGFLKKKKIKGEQNESKASQEESEFIDTPLKRKNGAEISFCSFKKKKKGIKGIEGEPSLQNGLEVPSKSLKRKATADKTSKWERVGNNIPLKEEMGISVAKKGFKSPSKINKVCQLSGGKKSKILVKDKAGMHKSLHKKIMKGAQKSKVVQSLNEKFSAAVRDDKLPSTEIRKDSDNQRDDKICSNKLKKKSSLIQDDVEKLEQISGPYEVINNQDKNCELSNGGHGKFRRRLKNKLKDRKLVCPLGEIYIPANVAKTEDFLTFLCLRGNSSLPRCFDVFKDPDPFFTQPAQQFPGDKALPCPAFPAQSSVTYSPPSSCTPSESSAASPMSSTDGWMINDD